VKESSYNTASKFSDVAKGQWYAPYVNWAVKKGITDGTGTSTFSPNQAITREQMAAMIYRYIKAYGLKPWDSYIALSEFEDYITVSFYAQKAVDLVRDSGIMFGKDDDKFHPKDYATRAEAAAVCYRLIAATEKNTENIFAEIPSSFVYNPGAVWLTSFNLQSNGTFEGNWHTSSAWNDRAIGDFTGKFSTPQRVSEHVYAMRLEYVYPDKTYAEEYIKEGWNVIDGIMEAGFADANDALFYIYLPGLAISELPDYARFALTKDEQNQQYLTRHMIYRKGCELAYWS
jgi:hypothetical protein